MWVSNFSIVAKGKLEKDLSNRKSPRLIWKFPITCKEAHSIWGIVVRQGIGFWRQEASDLWRDQHTCWYDSTQWHAGQVMWFSKGDAYKVRNGNKVSWFRKQITAFLPSYVQHLISKLLQPEKPIFPFLQNEWRMLLSPPGNVLCPRAQWKEACLVISMERDHRLCQLWNVFLSSVKLQFFF